MELEYRPTEIMRADLLNNQKQGKAFRDFIGELINLGVGYNDDDGKKGKLEIVFKEWKLIHRRWKPIYPRT